MATRFIVGVEVDLSGDTCVRTHIKHYEELKEALDHQEKGWREFDAPFGDGKVFVHLDLVRALAAVTESYAEARFEFDKNAELTP